MTSTTFEFKNVKTKDIGELLLGKISKSEGHSGPEEGEVRFLCDDGVRVAHRAVLEARSEHFREVLTSYRDISYPLIPIGVSTRVFDTILQFLYTPDKVEVKAEQLLDLIYAAKNFRLLDFEAMLKDRLKTILFDNFKPKPLENTDRESISVSVESYEEMIEIDYTTKLKLLGQISEWAVANKYSDADQEFATDMIKRILEVAPKRSLQKERDASSKSSVTKLTKTRKVVLSGVSRDAQTGLPRYWYPTPTPLYSRECPTYYYPITLFDDNLPSKSIHLIPPPENIFSDIGNTRCGSLTFVNRIPPPSASTLNSPHILK